MLMPELIGKKILKYNKFRDFGLEDFNKEEAGIFRILVAVYLYVCVGSGFLFLQDFSMRVIWAISITNLVFSIFLFFVGCYLRYTVKDQNKKVKICTTCEGEVKRGAETCHFCPKKK